jgi:hypothetical protein
MSHKTALSRAFRAVLGLRPGTAVGYLAGWHVAGTPRSCAAVGVTARHRTGGGGRVGHSFATRAARGGWSGGWAQGACARGGAGRSGARCGAGRGLALRKSGGGGGAVAGKRGGRAGGGLSSAACCVCPLPILWLGLWGRGRHRRDLGQVTARGLPPSVTSSRAAYVALWFCPVYSFIDPLECWTEGKRRSPVHTFGQRPASNKPFHIFMSRSFQAPIQGKHGCRRGCRGV